MSEPQKDDSEKMDWTFSDSFQHGFSVKKYNAGQKLRDAHRARRAKKLKMTLEQYDAMKRAELEEKYPSAPTEWTNEVADEIRLAANSQPKTTNNT